MASMKKVTTSFKNKIIKGSCKGGLVLTKGDVLLYCEGLTVGEFKELLMELTEMYAKKAMF